MTQKDKELLLKDLSARLPYGVKVQQFDDKYGYKLLGIDDDELHIDCPVYGEGDGYVEVDYCKPYLRPMLSMAEEERMELESLDWRVDELDFNNPWTPSGDIEIVLNGIKWLLKHHFDINGLIPLGLAIEVNESNNPYKE